MPTEHMLDPKLLRAMISGSITVVMRKVVLNHPVVDKFKRRDWQI